MIKLASHISFCRNSSSTASQRNDAAHERKGTRRAGVSVVRAAPPAPRAGAPAPDALLAAASGCGLKFEMILNHPKAVKIQGLMSIEGSCYMFLTKFENRFKHMEQYQRHASIFS